MPLSPLLSIPPQTPPLLLLNPPLSYDSLALHTQLFQRYHYALQDPPPSTWCQQARLLLSPLIDIAFLDELIALHAPWIYWFNLIVSVLYPHQGNWLFDRQAFFWKSFQYSIPRTGLFHPQSPVFHLPLGLEPVSRQALFAQQAPHHPLAHPDSIHWALSPDAWNDLFHPPTTVAFPSIRRPSHSLACLWNPFWMPPPTTVCSTPPDHSDSQVLMDRCRLYLWSHAYVAPEQLIFLLTPLSHDTYLSDRSAAVSFERSPMLPSRLSLAPPLPQPWILDPQQWLSFHQQWFFPSLVLIHPLSLYAYWNRIALTFLSSCDPHDLPSGSLSPHRLLLERFIQLASWIDSLRPSSAMESLPLRVFHLLCLQFIRHLEHDWLSDTSTQAHGLLSFTPLLSPVSPSMSSIRRL